MAHILKMFRERLREQQPATVKITAMTGRSGATVRDGAYGDVLAVSVPLGEHAEGRTIRLHESLHAAHVPLKLKKHHPWTVQAIEDARLHFEFWPEGFRQVDRDAAAVTVREVRAVGGSWEGISKELMGPAVTALVRGLVTATKTLTRQRLLADRQWQKVPALVRSSISAIALATTKEEYELAADMMDALLSTLEAEEPKGDASTEERERHGEEAFAEPKSATAAPTVAVGEGGRLSLLPTPSGVHTGYQPRMRIKELSPRYEPTENAKGRTRRPTSSGMKMRTSRLARALASGRLHGLFTRRTRRFCVAGTVVIDASSSMGVTPQLLLELLKCSPGATLAYYNSPDEIEGTLFVAARDGKLYTPRGDALLPRVGGGNGVDLEALQWLLRQKGPRVFISDGGFTGKAGEAVATTILLKNAIQHGTVARLFELSLAQRVFKFAKKQKLRVEAALEIADLPQLTDRFYGDDPRYVEARSYIMREWEE